MRAIATLTALLACAGDVSAQDTGRVNAIDSSAVAAFADDFFPREMMRRQIPGAVFVFVAGGEIAVARGFGAAQLEPRRPVDPDRTVFRLASVSKTITATAALQLVERHRIDLHTDINTYLTSFQLTAAHGPITLDHLLTNTAGFDERLTGAGARRAQDVQPTARYLARSMPPTFTAPGRVTSYSNHGYALIGHLVEEVSGRPFTDYVRDEIFEPLGMERSGSLTGPPPNDLAVAYEYVEGRHRALAPDYLHVSSAGAFFTTGTDMARLLIAHLRGGAYRERRILRPETTALMHAQHFTQTPDTSGWAYGLWEDARNGQRALLHDGGGKGYRALLYLLPQQDAGFFLAYNLADRHPDGVLQESLITQFRRRFMSAADNTVPHTDGMDPGPMVGEYLYVRRARTTVEKMIAIVNSRVRIARGEDGTLVMTEGSAGPVSLTAIGPRLFRRGDERGVVAFESATGSRPDRLVTVTGSGFPAVHERAPLIATLRAQMAWLLGMTLMFLYATVWRPIAALVHRAPVNGWNAQRWSAWLSGIASALNLVVLVGFPLAFFGRMEGGVPEFLYGVPAPAARLLLIPPVATLVSVAAAIALVGVWQDTRTSVTTRLAHTLAVAALLSFVVFTWYWNLMPPSRS